MLLLIFATVIPWLIFAVGLVRAVLFLGAPNYPREKLIGFVMYVGAGTVGALTVRGIAVWALS